MRLLAAGLFTKPPLTFAQDTQSFGDCSVEQERVHDRRARVACATSWWSLSYRGKERFLQP